jgi:hypothetical protein
MSTKEPKVFCVFPPEKCAESGYIKKDFDNTNEQAGCTYKDDNRNLSVQGSKMEVVLYPTVPVRATLVEK